MIPEYDVFAFRYATMSGRMSYHNAISTDPHESGSDLDFFVGLIRGDATARGGEFNGFGLLADDQHAGHLMSHRKYDEEIAEHQGGASSR